VIGGLWLLTLCLLTLCGFPLLAHPAYRSLGFASRVVLSGAVGAVLMSAAMTGAVLVGVHWNETALAVTAVLLAIGLRLAVRGDSGTTPRAESLGMVGAAAVALSVLAIGAALLAAWSASATSPDLVFFWGAKAQQFARARTVDVPFLQDAFHRYMHIYYPPFVTNVDAFATMTVGRFPWTAAILTFPLLVAALAAGLPGLLRHDLSRPAAAAWSALAVAAIAAAGIGADVAGNAEMPLLLFETLAAGLLVSAEARRGAIQLLAGILLAGAVTAKVEGLPFAAAVVALFLAAGVPREERPSAAWRLVLPGALCLGGWFLFGATRRLFVGYGGEGTLFDLHPGRLIVVAGDVGKALAATGYGLPWLVPLAALIAAAASSLRVSRRAWIPLGTAAVLTGFFLFTYLDRAEDPALWISWSAARIFIAVAMLLVIAGACAGGAAEPTPRSRARSPR